MRVVTVVGNRPQFVKASAVSPLIREVHEELLIHTGQHHDEELSAIFFEELGLATPERRLQVAGGGNASQLARMLAGLAPLLHELRPDVVLVYGDTNSTLAGALAAANAGIPLAHVEAGMRSFDRSQPEERNRVLTDHLAELLLCPTPGAVEHLRNEGLAGRARCVGDVMVDVAHAARARVAERTEPLERVGVRAGAYVLMTAHRPANVDPPEALKRLVGVIEAIEQPVVLPLHPRTRERLLAAGLLERVQAAAAVTAPLGYLDFAALLRGARAVLTDSGGVQKEAYLATIPCVTLRDRTEWIETVQSGWNVLVGMDRDAARAALERSRPSTHPDLFGDGRAAERVVRALVELAGAGGRVSPDPQP